MFVFFAFKCRFIKVLFQTVITTIIIDAKILLFMSRYPVFLFDILTSNF